MLPVARHGGRCIYCAFHAHQLRLQALRTSRALHLQPSCVLREDRGVPIRYTHHREDIGIYHPPRPRQHERQKAWRKEEGKTTDDKTQPSLFRKSVRSSQHVFRKSTSFEDIFHERLKAMKKELKDAPLLEELHGENDAESESSAGKAQRFEKLWNRYVKTFIRTSDDDFAFIKELEASNHNGPAMERLREAFATRGQDGLDVRIKHEFYAYVTNERFSPSDIKNQQALADLRYPSEWYPATRAIHRKIHVHVGPTNSGKTYHALQRLEQAESGIYAGPLRLLAHEVYTRMNAKGIPCSLITGEERRSPEVGTDKLGIISACTVEMMPLNTTVDVAVIDEIQMIGNSERGWAWTQALLGVKAHEVHLCGEERTVPLVRALCASVGEEVEIHRYERLSPLKVAEESLDGVLSKLRKGDCIVSFSVMGIHSLRRQIERATQRKVATVYGSLPPETRAQQARLFNDPDNDYDYLVASDAVGMGLNLAIKRIVFETSSKFDGYSHHTLSVADIKQIAGRAGRYRIASQAVAQQDDDLAATDLATAKGDAPLPSPLHTPSNDNVGYVTTLEKFDFPIVAAAMSSEPDPIRSAGIFPPSSVIDRFAGYFPPGTPFSYILMRLHELSQMHSRFHLCGLKDQLWLADLIEPVRNLTIADRNVISACPAGSTDRGFWKELMPAFARCIAEQAGGDIVDIVELPLELLEAEVSTSREYLRELERLHKGIVAYLWLSYRFAGVFGQRTLAFHIKRLVEEKIEAVLERFSFSELAYKRAQARREQAVLRDLEKALTAATVDADGNVVEADERDGEVEEEGGGEDITDETLREQTSVTAGGDHFSGELDLELEDPLHFDVDTPKDESRMKEMDDLDERERHMTNVSSEPPPNHQDQGLGAPPKQIPQWEVNDTELERNVDSRP